METTQLCDLNISLELKRLSIMKKYKLMKQYPDNDDYSLGHIMYTKFRNIDSQTGNLICWRCVFRSELLNWMAWQNVRGLCTKLTKCLSTFYREFLFYRFMHRSWSVLPLLGIPLCSLFAILFRVRIRPFYFVRQSSKTFHTTKRSMNIFSREWRLE